jgi:aquaporin Z
MPLAKKLIAEFFGTFWLVLGGCGSAVLAATFLGVGKSLPGAFPLGIGLAGVSLAFGLTVLTMAYAVGHISGGHFNPAVSFGLWAANRFPGGQLLPYILAQCLGAFLGAVIIAIVAEGIPGFGYADTAGNFASNGFGDLSPGGYSALACFVIEFVLTFMFLLIILGATDRLAPKGFAPIAIGLALTLIHLISIPVTNTSVNPARSLSQALGLLFFGGKGGAISQIWMFWLAPILGALLAGWVYRNYLASDDKVIYNAD